MCSTENGPILSKKSKLSWLLIMKVEIFSLYNDSFFILIGHAKSGIYSKQSYKFYLI